MKIFVSHVHEEFEIANMVKQQLNQLFGAMVDVFLSEDIKLGDNWLAAVKSSLLDSDSVFVLFSRTSHSRPWINIEAGYGVMAGKQVVPICCLGLKKSELSVVYSLQQAMQLTDAGDVIRLLETIAERTPAKRLLVEDRQKVAQRWVEAARIAESLLPVYTPRIDEPVLVWLIGSVNDVPDPFRDRAFKTADALSASFINAGFRVVLGRSNLLNYMADRIAYESINSVQNQTGDLPQLLATKAARSESRVLNPVILLGSLRAAHNIRRVFVDCVGRVPDVAIALGGTIGGRAAEEARMAVEAGIPLLPLHFTGGAAANSTTTFDPSLREDISAIQASTRGSDGVGERVRELIVRQVQVQRGTGQSSDA